MKSLEHQSETRCMLWAQLHRKFTYIARSEHYIAKKEDEALYAKSPNDIRDSDEFKKGRSLHKWKLRWDPLIEDDSRVVILKKKDM